MMEFFQFLFLWVFGGRRGRQELARILERESRELRRMNNSLQRSLEAMNEIMEDSTTDLLEHHRSIRRQARQTATT